MPSISVVLPVYKVEPYLRECVDSILNQSFDDFELIMINDGSPDLSPFLCDNYAKLDKRVIIIHQANGGLSAARNTGLDYIFLNSNSKYITFIDSDDYVSKDYLLNLYSFIKKNKDVKIAISGFYQVNSLTKEIENKTTLVNEIFNSNQIFKRALFEENGYVYTISCSKLFSRSFFDEKRFIVGKIQEDEYMSNVIYNDAFLVGTINKISYFYRINKNGIIANYSLNPNFDGFDAIFERYCLCKKNSFYSSDKEYMEKFAEMLYLEYRYIRRKKTNIIKYKEYLVRAIKMIITIPNNRKTILLKMRILKTLITK